jgi:hypothetical protein
VQQLEKGVFAVKVAIDYTKTLYHREIIEAATIAEANAIAQAQCEEGLLGPDAFEDSSETSFDLEVLPGEEVEDTDTASDLDREEGNGSAAV